MNNLTHQDYPTEGYLQLFHNFQELGSLRKLELSWCDLGDEHIDIGSGVWELPNLQELNLKGNKFSRLNFHRLRLPRLKWLNVSYCSKLVELSEIPSSIAVVIADDCSSLVTFGDISNCKWLWKLSLRESYVVNPRDGETLLDSMLQGNAIKDHFISAALQHQISKKLAYDWYNDFCGFLIRIVTNNKLPDINVILTHEVDEKDSRFEIWQPHESYEAPEREYDFKVQTYVGYVTFSSLRQTTSLNSSYNIISFSIENTLTWRSFGVLGLVPRDRTDDPVQTTNVATDSSEYWNDELDIRKAFTIQHDLYSFIQILWQP
ncbi:unnamed protein product [Lactuca virosa]|uniref:Uncharacterized protein n=1 Tax=Lactuca virosa TaxID=75947 RepID=A0AAU9LTZ1_9ASTR|nr:unnamed protein product [Lactuca virosa]